ncbi:MAG: MFS transporter [Mycobacterium sp.]
MNQSTTATGRWREFLERGNFAITAVLTSGVGIYAMNEFITISLLPNVVAEIGGERRYEWVTTLYLVASVIPATSVGATLTRFGPRRAYSIALLVFAAGSVLCALAPTMTVLLGARVLQGLGGGALAGLGYAMISAALPERLWSRAAALVSVMFGVGTLVSSAIGGFDAEFVSWRAGFGLLAVLALMLLVFVPIAMPTRLAGRAVAILRIPVRSLVLLGGAALAISGADIPENTTIVIVLLLLGVLLVLAFVAVDRGSQTSVLPRKTFGPGPLKWIYLTLGILMAAMMVDTYVPLFAEELDGVSPLVAGFLGAALAIGTTVGQILSASIARAETVMRVVAVAPVVMASGLVLAAAGQRSFGPTALIATWTLGLVIAGAGAGLAWPHLSAWAMAAVVEPGQKAVAAAAVNTVQLTSAAFGAGLAGVLVDLHGTLDKAASTTTFLAFAALVAVGTVASCRAARPAPV